MILFILFTEKYSFFATWVTPWNCYCSLPADVQFKLSIQSPQTQKAEMSHLEGKLDIKSRSKHYQQGK